jgi:TonB family protein
MNVQTRPANKERAPVQVGITHDAPIARSVVLPRRSAEAVRMGRRGPVIAEIRVDEAGRCSFVQVLKGDLLLNDAARQAVEKWTYAPVMFEGRPTPVTISVAINFTDL